MAIKIGSINIRRFYSEEELALADSMRNKQIMINDVMVIRGRKLPKFLRVEIENKKTRKEETKTFNKRQLKHSN